MVVSTLSVYLIWVPHLVPVMTSIKGVAEIWRYHNVDLSPVQDGNDPDLFQVSEVPHPGISYPVGAILEVIDCPVDARDHFTVTPVDSMDEIYYGNPPNLGERVTQEGLAVNDQNLEIDLYDVLKTIG